MASFATALSVPESYVMEGWNTIADARGWAGVTNDEWSKLAAGLGDPEADSLLLLASIDDEDWITVRNGAGLPIIRKGAANLLFAAVKAKFMIATSINAPRATAPPAAAEQQQHSEQQQGLQQQPPAQPPAGTAPLTQQRQIVLGRDEASGRVTAGMRDGLAAGSAMSSRDLPTQGILAGMATPGNTIAIKPASFEGGLKVNLGLVLNQGLTQEVPMLPMTTLAAIRDRYITIEGDEPMEQTDVTNAQITALNAVLDQGMAPYADFGVFGPHGNRHARKQKFTNMYLDTAGRWHTAEQAGPANLEAWRNSWAVFTAATIMLGVATPATLGRYARRFEERCHRYPKAWFLAVLADDRCRSEFWTAELRRQERFHRDHPALSAFVVTMPWESIIKESTTNVDFWMRELQEPAISFTKEHSETAPSWVNQQISQDRGQKRTWEQGQNATQQQKGAQKHKGAYITNEQGTGLCRNFQNGACRKGSECYWAHQCSLCLGTHPSNDCQAGKELLSEKGGKKKGGGKFQKKGRGKGKKQ